MKVLTKEKEKELKVLTRFVQVFCREHCGTKNGDLCAECRDLLAYASARLENCPFDPKPKCRNCRVHCYQGRYRRMIREVMRFSGIHFVKRGRLDWLLRYFLSG